MASALSYTLSAEELALFRELQSNAIFSEIATPLMNPVADIVKQKQKDTERLRLEPYADILLPILVHKMKLQMQDMIASLKDAAEKGEPLEVTSLWWNTVVYNRSLTEKLRAEADMSLEERHVVHVHESDLREAMKSSGAEHMVGIRAPSYYGYDEDNAENYTLWPVKLERILRVTDLRYRIALALGPNFFPSIRFNEQGYSVEGVEGYTVWRKELVFRFYPFGLDKYKMKTMLAAFKRQKERESAGTITTLDAHDWVECEQGEWARPPLAKRTNGGGVTLLGSSPVPAPASAEGGWSADFLYRAEASGIRAYPLPIRSHGGGIEACEQMDSPPRLERQTAEAPGAPRKGFVAKSTAAKDLFAAFNAAGVEPARCFCGCSDEESDE